MELDAMAAALEATGNYRVLRKVIPRKTISSFDGSPTRTAIFLDVETTGLDPLECEIIELAMVPFSYSTDGRIFQVSEPFHGLRERVHGVVQVGSFESVGSFVADVVAKEASIWMRNHKGPVKTLDFGCGCGRVLAYLANILEIQATGTDIDQEAISWCRTNLAQLGAFHVNEAMPPLDLASQSFDLIFSISVMTHLPERMQFAWLAELSRIARPGAVLLLTVRDTHDVDLKYLQVARYRWRGFLHCGGRVTPGLPDFYRSTFHNESYIRRHWSKYFEVLDFKPRAINGDQDLVVCRKPMG